MTEWGEWDECSATCGMGMKKRHRMVKMSPADGSMCKAETSQAEKCMMPECREWAWERGQRTTAALTMTTVKAGQVQEEIWTPPPPSLQGTSRSESYRCEDIIQTQRVASFERHSEQCWGGKLVASG